MRITEQQRKVIVESVHEVFGPDATVRLFGSRALAVVEMKHKHTRCRG